MAKVQVTLTSQSCSPTSGAVTFSIDKVEIDPGLVIDDDVDFQITTTLTAGGAFGCLLNGKPFHIDYVFTQLETGTITLKTDPVSVWAPDASGTMVVTSPWFPAGDAPDRGFTYQTLIKAHFDLDDCVDPVFCLAEFLFEVAP